MKSTTRSLALGSLLIAVALPVLGQQSQRRTGIPGYLDPLTGGFHPSRTIPDPDAAAKLTTYTGTLEFQFVIKVASVVPSGHEILCSATADLVDISTTPGGGENVIDEEASVVAKQTGTSATCTVLIPYSWSLINGPLDTVGLSYSVEIIPTSTTTPLFGSLASRISSQLLPSIAVPRTGTTTTKTIDATV